MIAGICAAQILVEGFHRFFAAHVVQNAFRLQRLAAPGRNALELELRVSAALRWAGPRQGQTLRRGREVPRSALSTSASSILWIFHLDFEALVLVEFKFR